MERFAQFMGGASSFSIPYDRVFVSLLAISGIVMLGIAFCIIYFSVKYRRGSKANRGSKASRTDILPSSRSRIIEFTWIFIPLGFFLVFFVWAANLYIGFYGPPEKSDLEIKVIGKQWMWKIQHPGGKQEVNELHVPRGSTVQLTMISRDVIHSFFIPAFRIKHDVLPGRYYTMWFRPLKTGEYHLFCAEYCGMGHSYMTGEVIVMEPSAYAEWLRK